MLFEGTVWDFMLVFVSFLAIYIPSCFCRFCVLLWVGIRGGTGAGAANQGFCI